MVVNTENCEKMYSLKELLLHLSEGVPALLHSIETSSSDTNPTGHSLCHALGSSWISLLQEIDGTENLPQAGSCSQTGKSVSEEEEDGRPSSVYWAQVALDYSWEQLHSGHWAEVKRFWREAYALAALLKGLNLYLKGQVEQSLVEIDKGILMGAPIINNSLHTVAAMMSKDLEANEVGVVSTQETVLNSGDNIIARKEELDVAMVDGVDSVLGSVDYTVAKWEGTDLPKKIGKVKFRNYTPSSQAKTATPFPPTAPPVSSLSDTPLIDMARRIPVVHCPSLEDFYKHHMTSSVPVVVSGAMDYWPAYAEKRWR